MARIIGGSMIGELSGKLGGNVFARNKAGAYIRQYVIPVDPKSIAQINARTNFGAASSSYHSMTPAQKAQWQDFAQNFYLPKNGANTGQFSGINAFVSLANAAINASSLNPSGTSFEINGSNVMPSGVLPFELTTTAPHLTIQANLVNTAGNPISYSFSQFILKEDGSCTSQFLIDSAPIALGQDLPGTFKDGNGNDIGFIFYASNPVQQKGMFYANPEKIALFSAPNVTLPGASTGATITFGHQGNVVDTTNYQSWYNIGNWVKITAYAISTTGQMIRIGSIETQVVA